MKHEIKNIDAAARQAYDALKLTGDARIMWDLIAAGVTYYGDRHSDRCSISVLSLYDGGHMVRVYDHYHDLDLDASCEVFGEDRTLDEFGYFKVSADEVETLLDYYHVSGKVNPSTLILLETSDGLDDIRAIADVSESAIALSVRGNKERLTERDLPCCVCLNADDFAVAHDLLVDLAREEFTMSMWRIGEDVEFSE